MSATERQQHHVEEATRSMFKIEERRLDGPGLSLRYHRVPWDEPILGAPVAAISKIEVVDEAGADSAYPVFQEWCLSEGVVLVSCRLEQVKLKDCGFLEMRGFRFIELNYRPFIVDLADRDLGEPDEIEIEPALPSDESAIAGIAARIFDTGRLHLDPFVGPEIGNRRYRVWAENAFRNISQSVLKCLIDGRIIGFFVVECPAPASRFWSLIGLAPGLAGRGLGRRVWLAMLRWHRAESVNKVSTSMSSHNIPMMNLYVSLGFRFPAPSTTLHWCPVGPVANRAGSVDC